jgi:uncharacterized membrane protein
MLALAIEITLYACIFSYISILRYRAFDMYAWDLGVYHQSIHTTVTTGDFFFNTIEYPYTQTAIPSGTEFAVHFSPILILVLPLYALLKSPITLLILKSIAIALGVYPVYFLALKRIKQHHIALAFSTGYLLLPIVHAVNWFDFQPQALIITPMLFAVLYLDSGRTKPAVLSLLAAFSTIEIAPLLGIAVSLSYYVIDYKSYISMLVVRKYRSFIKSTPTATLITSLVWLMMTMILSYALGWQGSFHLSNTRRVSLLMDLNILSALSFDWQSKLVYVVLILAPLGFLSMLDAVRLFPGILWMSLAVLSNYPPFYHISFHYLALVIPFVVDSSISGFSRVYYLMKRRRHFVSILLISSVVLGSLVGSPVGTISYGNHPWTGPFGLPIVTQHDVLLQSLVDMVPENASILTQNNVFPHVSGRREAYVFPFSSTFPTPGSFQTTLEDYFQRVEYIIVDQSSDQISATIVAARLSTSRDFGILAEADGGILLKRNYSGPPQMFIPYNATYDFRSLGLKNGTIVEDPASQSGKVLYKPSSGSQSDFWYGPGVFLASGEYVVDFTLKASVYQPSDVIVLAIVAWPANITIQMIGSDAMWYIPKIHISSLQQQPLATRKVHSSEFYGQEYQSFQLRFKVEKASGFEFVGLEASSNASIWLDKITLVQEST